MLLQGYHGEFDSMVAVRGSKDNADVAGVIDAMPPALFSQRKAVARLKQALREIVSGAAPDSAGLRPHQEAVTAIYLAFGSAPRTTPELRVSEDDLAKCAQALADRGLAAEVRILDWSRGSPLLAGGDGQPPHFAYMTPGEVAASAGRVGSEDWTPLPETCQAIMRTVAAWIDEAAKRPKIGVFVSLWP